MEGCGDCEDTNTPAMVSWVVLSTRVHLLRSTERRKKWRKSVPRIGLPTSATTIETQVEGERLSSKMWEYVSH